MIKVGNKNISGIRVAKGQYRDYVMGVVTKSKPANLEVNIEGASFIALDYIYAANVKITGATSTTVVDWNANINTNIDGIINLPDLTKIQGSCWCYTTINCTCIYMPNVKSIGANFLQAASVPKMVKMVIGASPFTNVSSTGSMRGTSALKALVLKVSSVPTLNGTTAAVQSYLYKGDDAYIYVPRSLKSSFESASNWNIFKFRAIEDYPLIDAPDTWLPES